MKKTRPFLIPGMPRMGQRGAALLMAMVIVTLVATLAASMVWQQWRAVQVEGSERVRSQAGWVLSGALDWARLILREDAKSSPEVDHLNEPWALPLAEARLSTFLAADASNNAGDDDDSPEAFLSGKVEDAQAKFNLINLLDSSTGDIAKEQVEALGRLCETISLSPALATGLAQAYQRARYVMMYAASPDPAILAKLGGEQGRAQVPLMPLTVDQVLWLGLDAATAERLRPFVTLLPRDTLVNVNTASREVIAAVVPGLDLGRAGRLVQARQRKPFKTRDDIEQVVGKILLPGGADPFKGLSYSSEFFEVSGRLRYEDNVIEQRHLVQRAQGGDVTVLHQSRFSGVEPVGQGGSPP